VRGTIVSWNEDRGFGFIGRDGGGTDLFVHIRDVAGARALPAGTQVEFEEGADKSGRYRATNVGVVS
jgi:cold shock CspA family protein